MYIYPLQYPRRSDLLSSVITRIILSTLVLRVKYKLLIFHTAVFLPIFYDMEPHLPPPPKQPKNSIFMVSTYRVIECYELEGTLKII